MNINIKIIESEEYEDIQIIIKCPKVNDQIKQIIEKIEQNKMTLSGEKNGRIYSLDIHAVYYIESVDNKTFVYTEKEVFETNLKRPPTKVGGFRHKCQRLKSPLRLKSS